MRKGKAIAFVALGLVAGLVLGTVGVSYAATGATQQTRGGLGLGLGQAVRDAGGRLVDIVADLTGLSVEEVQAARADGQSIATIAESNGVSSDDVVGAALDARKDVLDAKVADGSITQAQADAAYTQMSERIAERVSSDATGRPSWGGQGRGQGACQGTCGTCVAND